jgi:PhnB protein
MWVEGLTLSQLKIKKLFRRMAKLNPYLGFNGNCEEAFNHYKAAFGGEFQSFIRFKDAPPSDHAPSNPELIMHVSLPMGGGDHLMGSDTMDGQPSVATGNNVSLSVTTDTEDETNRVFNKLAEGGQVTMPPMPTFWSPLFGMCVDKFGISWMVGMASQNPM